MTHVDLNPAIRGLAQLEKRIKWVFCPWCLEEWTKLRPCDYWHPDLKSFSVCVECAETAKGFKFLVRKFPIPGVEVSIFPNPNIPAKYRTARSNNARISYGEWGFAAWPESERLWVLENRKTNDQKKSFDNTFQVWFSLKSQFEKGPELVKKGWQ